jgi:hypothetical protein
MVCARQLVANTLTFLGLRVRSGKDIFGTEQGDLRAVLRRRIDSCKGWCNSWENVTEPSLDEQFGRFSYTRYEALYACSKGKKVWYLSLDESFPTDPHEEQEEKQKLQRV